MHRLKLIRLTDGGHRLVGGGHRVATSCDFLITSLGLFEETHKAPGPGIVLLYEHFMFKRKRARHWNM